MTLNLFKIRTLLLCLTFILTISCSSSDDCSNKANSVPPSQIVGVKIIDPNNQEIQLDSKLIKMVSLDKNEIIDRVSTFFSGFTISTKNPITSNKIELEYNSQKILELNYDKQKTRVDCHSDHYYIQNTTLNIVSQDYILEQQIIDYTNITYIIRLVNLDTVK
jgi:hypothetical protein